MTQSNLAAVPAVGSDPRSVRFWWAGLTDPERRWLIENRSDLIGRLDGVPAAARDQANRIVIGEAQVTLQSEQQSLTDQLASANTTADRDRLQAQLDGVNGKLKGINAILTRLDHPAPGQDRGY